MTVAIHEVRSKRQLKRFMKFPFTLYKNHPYWIPPLLMDEWKTLDWDKNPAFKYCRVKYWLAEKDGRLVGRIAGIINERFIEASGNRYGRFGWLDFVDDREVSGALFQTMEDWAREQGMTAVHGPLGFTGLDREGMLIEGFDEMGTMATLYNYPYYPEHLEAMGYRKDLDSIEFEITTPERIPEKALQLEKYVLERNKLRLVEGKKNLYPYAKKMFELVNEGYSGQIYGFVELTKEEVDVYIKEYYGFLDADYVNFIIDEREELIAFGIAMPSLSRALQKSRGRLFPFGFIHLLLALKFPKHLDFLLVAVRSDYKAKGIPAILMTEITRNCQKNGIRTSETNPENETNSRMHAFWKYYPARQHKRRRFYIKTIS